MLFQLNSKWFRYSRYEILNEKGGVAYEVKGKFWTLGHDLRFLKADGTEIGFIRSNRIMNFGHKYELFLGKKLFGTFKKDQSWFKPTLAHNFKLDVAGPDDYSIRGDFWKYDFEFLRKNQKVATVSRKFFSFGDKYGVEIEKGEDEVAILASTIALDLVRRSRAAACA